MISTKILLLIAAAGHLICWHCDWIITVMPGGKFDFSVLKGDNAKLSAIVGDQSLEKPLRSVLLGVLAMAMYFCGYYAVFDWMRQFSAVYAWILFASLVTFIIPGVAHHVFCGAIEWFYIRLGKTEEARDVIVEFFKKTSLTIYAAFIGIFAYCTAFFIAVLTGVTSLPAWCCVFNVLPLFIVLALALRRTKIVGVGNLAGAIMMLGLFFVI